MEDLNKITSTRVGDNIHFFVNGKEDNGTVVKMNTSFVTVVKDNGVFQDIHINDTFFIKDILVNKTWNDMSMEERTVELYKVHAYSPRFLAKSWQQLPKELKDVMLEKGKKGALHPTEAEKFGSKMYDEGKEAGENQFGRAIVNAPKSGLEILQAGKKKSDVEQGAYGSIGQRPNAGINTNQEDDADDDYEGQTEDEKKEQFKHEELKPTTKSMQEEIWEQWLDKGEGMGEGSAPANNGTSSTNENGLYNPVYGDKGRHGGQGKDKEEEEEEDKKDDKKDDKKEEKKE